MNASPLPAIIHFFITPHSRGWQVCVDRQAPINFRNREAAVAAAMDTARKIWESFRERTMVQIQDEHGWRVMDTFGA